MPRSVVVFTITAAACASVPVPRVVRTPVEAVAVTPPPARPSRVETGLEALRRQLQPLRSVPAGSAEIPAEARPYLRAMRAGLRAWLLERVQAQGGVPPRVVLRAELDATELTSTRAGEDLAWGSVTRVGA